MTGHGFSIFSSSNFEAARLAMKKKSPLGSHIEYLTRDCVGRHGMVRNIGGSRYYRGRWEIAGDSTRDVS